MENVYNKQMDQTELDKIKSLSATELYTLAINTRDEIDSFIYLLMASNYGHELATNALSNRCSKDSYVMQCKKIISFCNLTKEFVGSATYLGLAYINGCTGLNNYDKAIELFNFAISQNYIDAYFYLGQFYDRSRDKTLAIQTYKLGADQNNINCIVRLGNIYMNLALNNREKHQFDEARIHFRLAEDAFRKGIEKGNIQASEFLAKLYSVTQVLGNQEYVINYLFENNQENLLKKIYNYDDYAIKMIKQNRELVKENQDLRTHILAKPDGELFMECLKSFNEKKTI